MERQSARYHSAKQLMAGLEPIGFSSRPRPKGAWGLLLAWLRLWVVYVSVDPNHTARQAGVQKVTLLSLVTCPCKVGGEGVTSYSLGSAFLVSLPQAPLPFPPHPRKLLELFPLLHSDPHGKAQETHFSPLASSLSSSSVESLPWVSAHWLQPCDGPMGILGVGGKCQSFHPWEAPIIKMQACS